MDPAALETDLKKPALKPVYLWQGQENLLKERFLARLTALIPEGLQDFNLQVVMADDTPPGDVLELAQTMPLVSPPRVVIVKGVDRYAADDLNLLLKYLDNPNESTCLVLVAGAPDMRLKFFKALKKKGWCVDFQVPKSKGLADWVQEAMRRRGQDMTRPAAQVLIDRLGTDLTELDMEIEKISLYALHKKKVGVEDITAASRLGPTANVFILGDAVGDQKPEQALAALKDLLATQNHIPVLYMLVRHFRLLLKAKLTVEGLRSAEAAKVLGLPPFIARKYLAQARELSLDDIKKGLRLLQKANLVLVSDPAPPHLVMENLVLNLSSLRRNPRTGF